MHKLLSKLASVDSYIQECTDITQMGVGVSYQGTAMAVRGKSLEVLFCMFYALMEMGVSLLGVDMDLSGETPLACG